MSTPFLISFAIFAVFVAIVVYLIRCLAAFPESQRELAERGYSDHQMPGDDCCGDCCGSAIGTGDLDVSGHACGHACGHDCPICSEADTAEIPTVQFGPAKSTGHRFARFDRQINEDFPRVTRD